MRVDSAPGAGLRVIDDPAVVAPPTSAEDHAVNDVWWYLSRATGIVATVLAVAALVWGLFFSVTQHRRRRRPAWWLDLHNYLGGLALVFTGRPRRRGRSRPELGTSASSAVLVPGAAHDSTWAITWGVIATYICRVRGVHVVATRRFSRRSWRIIHLGRSPASRSPGFTAFQIGIGRHERRSSRSGCPWPVPRPVYAIVDRVFGVIDP